MEREKPITLGDGVNTYKTPFEISKSECVSCLNTSSRDYPSLSVRPGSVVQYGTDSTALTENAIGVRDGTTFVVQDGTTLKYWNGAGFTDLATGLTNSKGKIVEFSNNVGDKYTVLFNGTDRRSWDGSTVTDLTEAPATNLLTVDDYRMYALLDGLIYHSAIYSVSDWTTVDDAGKVPIAGMIGTETAIVGYNDMVIAFSDQTMHVLYGNDYADFQLADPINVGCVSDRSIVQHDGILYFMDYQRFMAFTGGLPVDISKKVRKYLRDINYQYKSKIVSHKWDKYIYVSIPYGATATDNNITLEYDTENKSWFVWNIGFSNFATIGQDIVGITTAGKAIKLQQGTADDATAIAWEHTTGVWDWNPIRPRKSDREYYFIINLPVGSTLTMAYSNSVDNNDFVTIDTFVANANEQNTQIKLNTSTLKDYTWKRFKFSGSGPCTIHYLEEYKRVKAR